jgi:ferredoxin
MRVLVDMIRCSSVGNCIRECPEVFRFAQGSKKAVAKMEEVPPRLQKKCIQAAQSCPHGAVIITR